MTEKEFQEEINRRINLMSEGDESIQSMQKKDYVQVVVFCGVCLVGIIIGAYL